VYATFSGHKMVLLGVIQLFHIKMFLICLLVCLFASKILFVSGLGYMTGAYAGYLMGSWQWALRVSVHQFSYNHSFYFLLKL